MSPSHNPFETPSGAPRLSILAASLCVQRRIAFDGALTYWFSWECESLATHLAYVEPACDPGFYGHVYGRCSARELYRPTLRAWWYAAWQWVRDDHRQSCFHHARDIEQWANEQSDKMLRAAPDRRPQTRHDGAGRTQTNDRAD